MKILRLLVLVLSALIPALIQAQSLQLFSSYYKAHTNGMSGAAERHLIQREDGSYRLNMSLEAKVIGFKIGELEQASEFEIIDQRLLPRHYSYLLSGITSKTETVSFNWDAGVARSRKNEQSWDVELSDQVLDEMTYQLAMSLQLQVSDNTMFEFDIIDGAEIATLQFRLLGEEILTTPLGRLNTVKVERLREESSRRSTLIWFAKDWNYLLAKIEQVNPSGLRIELELENALVSGEQVTALP